MELAQASTTMGRRAADEARSRYRKACCGPIALEFAAANINRVWRQSSGFGGGWFGVEVGWVVAGWGVSKQRAMLRDGSLQNAGGTDSSWSARAASWAAAGRSRTGSWRMRRSEENNGRDRFGAGGGLNGDERGTGQLLGQGGRRRRAIVGVRASGRASGRRCVGRRAASSGRGIAEGEGDLSRRVGVGGGVSERGGRGVAWSGVERTTARWDGMGWDGSGMGRESCEGAGGPGRLRQGGGRGQREKRRCRRATKPEPAPTTPERPRPSVPLLESLLWRPPPMARHVAGGTLAAAPTAGHSQPRSRSGGAVAGSRVWSAPLRGGGEVEVEVANRRPDDTTPDTADKAMGTAVLLVDTHISRSQIKPAPLAQPMPGEARQGKQQQRQSKMECSAGYDTTCTRARTRQADSPPSKGASMAAWKSSEGPGHGWLVCPAPALSITSPPPPCRDGRAQYIGRRQSAGQLQHTAARRSTAAGQSAPPPAPIRSIRSAF